MEQEAVAQLAAMFGLGEPLGHLDRVAARSRTSRRSGSRASCIRTRRSSRARTRTTRTSACAAVLGARARDRRRRTRAGASTWTRSPSAAAPRAASAPSSRRSGRRRSARVDDVGAIADLCAEHGARLHVDAAYGGFFTPARRRRASPAVAAAPFDGDRARRLDRRRPAQARPAALRLRLRAVRRSRRRPLLRARLALHVLHLARPAPRRDQPRVLARRRCGRGALGDAAARCR